MAFVRSEKSARTLNDFHCDVHIGSLTSAEDTEKALQHVQGVIHAAGGGKAHTPESFFQNNVLPTQHLISALTNHHVEKFILVSSLAAVGPSPANEPRQNHSPQKPLSSYGKSKAQAEMLVQQTKKHLQVGIIRPPTIYGPADPRLLPMFKAAQKGWAPIPGGRLKTLSLIHVQDCARAIVCALNADYDSGSAFFVDDGIIHSVESLVAAMGKAFQTNQNSLTYQALFYR